MPPFRRIFHASAMADDDENSAMIEYTMIKENRWD